LLWAWRYRLVWWVLQAALVRGHRRAPSVVRFVRDGDDQARALLVVLGSPPLPRL
jgi:hypothetical protein